MEILFILLAISYLIVWIAISLYTPPKPDGRKPDSQLSEEAKWTYYHLDAGIAARNDNHALAIYNYDKLIALDPRASFYELRAYSKLELEDFQGAIDDLTIALEKFTQANKESEVLALIYKTRANSYYSLNLFDFAYSDLLEAKKLGAEDVDREIRLFYPKHFSTHVQATGAACNPANEDTAFTDQLVRFDIHHLYHMTHRLNVKSILQNGILSHSDAHQGFNAVDIADNEVNIRRSRKETFNGRNLHSYVPLYFNPKNPMLYARKKIQDDIVILAIDRSVINDKNSIFTDGNAASVNTVFYNSLSDLDNLDWKCIRGNSWNEIEDGKRKRCAEVLVFPKIEVCYVSGIYCSNQNTLNYVKPQVPEGLAIEMKVNPELFFPSRVSNYSNPFED